VVALPVKLACAGQLKPALIVLGQHALCCAAGYNIRWLLRAIARGGLAAAFFAPGSMLTCLLALVTALYAALQGRSAAHLWTTGTNHHNDDQLTLAASN
jgi:hypothetical protein